MPFADKFKSVRLKRHATPGNFLDKIKEQTAQLSDRFNSATRAQSLDVVSERTGTLVADALVSPAADVTVIEPTDTSFTGAAMGGEGWTFGGTVYHFVAVASGVLQAGFNYLGKLIAGAGAVTLDADGVSLVRDEETTSTQTENAVKWVDGAGVNIGSLRSTYVEYSTHRQNMLFLASLANSAEGDDRHTIYLTAGYPDPVNPQIRIDTGDSAAGGSIEPNITLNNQSHDVDTVINGNAGELARFDAGLSSLGLGGAGESGYKLKVTGKIKTTNDADLASGLNVGTATGAGVGDVYGSGELQMTGGGASSVGGVFTAPNLWVTVRKNTDESRQSNTTLTVDSAIAATLTASKKYAFRGRVWFDTPAAADFKYSISFAGTTLYCKHSYFPAGSSTETIAIATATPASATVLGTGTTGGYVEFEGIAIVDGSNRALNFNWAQNTSTASNTTVKAGSYMEYLLMG